MHPLLATLSTAGSLQPGEVYIFTETEDRWWNPDPLAVSYVIKSEDELAAALEMEMFKVLTDFYDFKEYLGCEKIAEDCYAFKMQAFDKTEEIEEIFCLYLHRIMNFQEKLADVIRLESVN